MRAFWPAFLKNDASKQYQNTTVRAPSAHLAPTVRGSEIEGAFGGGEPGFLIGQRRRLAAEFYQSLAQGFQ